MYFDLSLAAARLLCYSTFLYFLSFSFLRKLQDSVSPSPCCRFLSSGQSRLKSMLLLSLSMGDPLPSLNPQTSALLQSRSSAWVNFEAKTILLQQKYQPAFQYLQTEREKGLITHQKRGNISD